MIEPEPIKSMCNMFFMSDLVAGMKIMIISG